MEEQSPGSQREFFDVSLSYPILVMGANGAKGDALVLRFACIYKTLVSESAIICPVILNRNSHRAQESFVGLFGMQRFFQSQIFHQESIDVI